MPLIEALLLLLVLSRVLGEVVARLGQPAMIGEIAAGGDSWPLASRLRAIQH